MVPAPTPGPAAASPRPPAASAYWQHTLRLSQRLLLLWAVVTLAVCWWGASLSFSFFDWPFGFWATAQGALGVFCGIVWYYAWAMNRLDRLHAKRGED